jgi:hypothetical protein
MRLHPLYEFIHARPVRELQLHKTALPSAGAAQFTRQLGRAAGDIQREIA